MRKADKKENNFPKLTNLKTIKKDFKNDTALSRSSSNILYIGVELDTIKLDYELVNFPFMPPPPPPPPGKNEDIDTIKWNLIASEYSQKFKSNPVYPFYYSWGNSEKFDSWNDTKLLIEIDTNTITKQLVTNRYFQKEYYPAYPILIKNEGTDTIIIGYDRFIPIILEAKDSTKQWKPIEKMFSFKCGNGINSILLPPNNIIISSKVIYKGDYKTHLRIKLGENYSNEFKGSINYSQFQNSEY